MTDSNGWPKEALETLALAIRDADQIAPPGQKGWLQVASDALAALAPFIAAREAATAEATREACAAIVDAHAAAAKRCSEEADVIYRIRAEFLANHYAITQAADDVRVTPLPAPDALARALAEEAGVSDAERIARAMTAVQRREVAGAVADLLRFCDKVAREGIAAGPEDIDDPAFMLSDIATSLDLDDWTIIPEIVQRAVDRAAREAGDE